MSKRSKKIKQQELRVAKQNEDVINNVLKFSKKRFKQFDEIINSLFMNEDLSTYFADRRIWKVYDCFSKVSTMTKMTERTMMKNVFIYVHNHSVLFSGEDYIHTVYNMIRFKAYWQNDVFKWRPISKHGAEQVNELAYYLFCQYPVPGCLYKAFFEESNMLYLHWFIHIGAGKKIRELVKMPIPFTQKMGHYFLQSPGKFTVKEALRWAQVKGLNGSDQLAERLAYSWMAAKTFGDEKFWEGFIRILVNGGMFDHDQLTQLIDYVRYMKHESRNYNLKGRTLRSLLRQSDEWHEKSMFIRGARFWTRSGLSDYLVERKTETVKIEELTGSKLLAEEGRSMKHCVATYANLCLTGQTAIFSLRKYSEGILTERLGTIEVNLALKRIVQAKAKMNRKISDEARKHLDEWAYKNDLSVSPYL